MGYDAYFHIDRKQYTRKDIENLLLLLGYVKGNKGGFYCGSDNDYKYDSGVFIKELSGGTHEYLYWVRTQIWCSGYDIKLFNDTLRTMRKYCNAWFTSDNGKNRYIEEEVLISGAENGCYIAASKAHESIAKLKFSLQQFPLDSEQFKALRETTGFSPEMINANIYSTYLCAVLEEYFRASYIAILRSMNERRVKLITGKYSSYDLIDVDAGKKTIDEVYARTLSFQNIHKIHNSFCELDKIDIKGILSKPYHRRKQSLFEQMDEVFERRHGLVHRVIFDNDFDSSELTKTTKDMEAAIGRVYKGICDKYGWTVRYY